MLGPIVALLLLTSPAAGPVDQLCTFTCSDSGTTSGGTSFATQWQRDYDRQQLENRLERIEQQLRQDRWNPPAPSLPSSTSSSCTFSGIRIC